MLHGLFWKGPHAKERILQLQRTTSGWRKRMTQKEIKSTDFIENMFLADHRIQTKLGNTKLSANHQEILSRNWYHENVGRLYIQNTKFAVAVSKENP